MEKVKKKSFATIDSLTSFGTIFLIIEIIVLLLFAIFVRMPINIPNDVLSLQRMLSFLATNMMAILGFGVFLSFGTGFQITPVVFALLCLVICWQLHVLMYSVWDRVMTGFDKPISITMDLVSVIRASRCGLSGVIGISAILGRISIKELIKILPIFVFGYGCNQVVIQKMISASDPGGTFIVFAYGSAFAIIFSFILGKKQVPHVSIQQSYHSLQLALLGTFVLWICWPLFNCGTYPVNSF